MLVTGQPAGAYDIALFSSDGLKAIAETTVTVDACVTPPSLSAATPNAPTFSDKAGTVDDTYSVVDTAGVTYLVGNVVTTGTHPGTGMVTVTAEAQSGYVLAGTRTWSFQFTDVVGSTSITPAAPTFTDKAGTAHDTYTVPSMVGVQYLVDGVLTATGTYPGAGTVTITAQPTAGHVLNGTTTWTFQFTDVGAPDVGAPQAVAPTTTTVASVVPPAVAGQPALNPGFGAKTGWGEDGNTPTGNSPFAPVLLTMAGLGGLAFYLRRKTGEQ